MRSINKAAQISVSALFIIVLFSCGCDPRKYSPVKPLVEKGEEMIARQTEEAIRNSPTLQKLDEVCNQVPKPEDFQLTRKGGLDDQVAALSYYYLSAATYEDSRLLWLSYFEKNGWEKVRDDDLYPRNVRFKNKEYEVSITYGGMGESANYSIHCEILSNRY